MVEEKLAWRGAVRIEPREVTRLGRRVQVSDRLAEPGGQMSFGLQLLQSSAACARDVRRRSRGTQETP